VLQARSRLHLVLYGPHNAWGARIGCGPRALTVLAATSILLHALDLLTGIRLMLVFGIDQELNPLARAIFQDLGPLGLTVLKLGVVLTGVLALLYLAHLGRPRLARNALLVVGLLGLLGFSSNLV
jgi:hypothetical protein